MIISFLIKSL